jgi:pectate lyase
LIEENKESAATGGNNQDGTLTSQLEEFKESMARKSSIIIFRAEESKKTEPKERKVEDIAIVNELCKITGTNNQTIKNVTRLGQLACQCPVLVVYTCGGTLFVFLDQGFNFI